MTRLQILSDLHLEVARMPEPRLAPGVDVVVVAGDVVPGAERGFAWLRRRFGPDVPIVTVAGNHEFYGRGVDHEIEAARRLAPRHGITFLQDDSATVGNLRFAGATLWTDYELYDDARGAMRRASHVMNDHRRITAFPPDAARARHRTSRAFLERTPCDVVVTHHLPSARSVHLRGPAPTLPWLLRRDAGARPPRGSRRRAAPAR